MEDTTATYIYKIFSAILQSMEFKQYLLYVIDKNNNRKRLVIHNNYTNNI